MNNWSFLLIFTISILLSACNPNKHEITGAYILERMDNYYIAEILEINADSSYVFSGLQDVKGKKSLCVSEGKWTYINDTLSLRTEGYGQKGHGSNINLDFLSDYADVEGMSKGTVIMRNTKFTWREDKLVRKFGYTEKTYKKQ